MKCPVFGAGRVFEEGLKFEVGVILFRRGIQFQVAANSQVVIGDEFLSMGKIRVEREARVHICGLSGGG